MLQNAVSLAEYAQASRFCSRESDENEQLSNTYSTLQQLAAKTAITREQHIVRFVCRNTCWRILHFISLRVQTLPGKSYRRVARQTRKRGYVRCRKRAAVAGVSRRLHCCQ